MTQKPRHATLGNYFQALVDVGGIELRNFDPGIVHAAAQDPALTVEKRPARIDNVLLAGRPGCRVRNQDRPARTARHPERRFGLEGVHTRGVGPDPVDVADAVKETVELVAGAEPRAAAAMNATLPGRAPWQFVRRHRGASS